MMKRTYGAKRSGTLDHKDIKLSVNDNNTFFEALYIKNIKQLKRDQSCIGASSRHNVTNNRVYKKKYVKKVYTRRHPIGELPSQSTDLTPDRSIHVKREIDLFDQLKSPSSFVNTPLEEISRPCTDNLFDHLKSPVGYSNIPTSAHGSDDIFNKLRFSKITDSDDKENIGKAKPNFTCNKTDSDDSLSKNRVDIQETSVNSVQPKDTSDIRKYNLRVEKVKTESKKDNDSINRLYRNTSHFTRLFKNDSLRRKSNINSIRVGQKNRITENVFTPPKDGSPLTSTPLLKKQWKNLMYCFSPIPLRTDFTENNEAASSVHLSSDLDKIDKSVTSYNNSQNNKEEDLSISCNTSCDKTPEEIEIKDCPQLNSFHQEFNESPFLGFTKVSNHSKSSTSKDNTSDDIFNSFDLIESDDSKVETSECDMHVTRDQSRMTHCGDNVGGFRTEPKRSTYNTCSTLDDSSCTTSDSDDSSSLNKRKASPEKRNQIVLQSYSKSKYLKKSFPPTQKSKASCSSSSKNNNSQIRINKSAPNCYVRKTSCRDWSNDSTASSADLENLATVDVSKNSLGNGLCVSIENISLPIETREKAAAILDDGDNNVSRSNESNSSTQFSSSESELSSSVSVSTQEEHHSSNSLISATRDNDQDEISSEKEKSLSCSESEFNLSNEEQHSPNLSIDCLEDKEPEEKCFSFVTTRRRNDLIDDSILMVFDQSSASSEEGRNLNNTVVVKEECNLSIVGEVPKTMDKGSLENSYLNEPSPKNVISPVSTYRCRPSYEKLKQKRKTNYLMALPDISESSSNNSVLEETQDHVYKNLMNDELEQVNYYNPEAHSRPSIVLQPGKKWERSLCIYRRLTLLHETMPLETSVLEQGPLEGKGRKYRESILTTLEMQNKPDSLHLNDSNHSRRSTILNKPRRSTIRIVKEPNCSRLSFSSAKELDDSIGFLSEDCDDTFIDLSKLSISDAEHEVTVLEKANDSERIRTARDFVLRRCNQSDALPFDECYPDTVLKNCRKIGEGVYGEVYLYRGCDGRARVMKVVPVAGTIRVNGEEQKNYHEIIPEIVIAMELSALRAPIADIEKHIGENGDILDAVDLCSVENATSTFNEVLAVRCVYGGYPARLLDLWDLYDETKGSENDNPAVLPVDQQYIVLELANAGQDLESYQFNNAEQAYGLFHQVAFGLAVGEEAFHFEHRDLHWGNVLIAPTDEKFESYVVCGTAHRVPLRGVRATIIDYSLSRVSLPRASERTALYNDLAHDDGLFDAVGDYQFEVYRLMREKLGNDWKNFEPYTNVLWLHYTVDKMITALRYKRTSTKIHKHYISKLKGIKDRLLRYDSALQFVLTDTEL